MKKILLSTSGTLGDILVIFPILAGIRARFPEAEISLLNKHGSKAADSPLELARSAGYVDRIRCISKPLLRLLSFLSFFPYPGRREYDTVFFLQRDGRTLARKIARERGYLERISRNPVRGLTLPPDAAGAEDRRRVMDIMLERINCDSDDPIAPGTHLLAFSAAEIAAADDFLRGLGVPPDAIPFAVCIGGKKSVSHWPLDNYVAVLREITRNGPGVPVFFGGGQDRENIRRVLESLPPGRAFYAEGVSRDLRKSICVMSRLKFYLGNDTGSIHMAAAAGLRCIGIYSSHSREGLWSPLGEGHRILRCSPEPECTGCRKQDCPFGTPARCIAAITVERVLHEAQEMLAASRPE